MVPLISANGQVQSSGHRVNTQKADSSLPTRISSGMLLLEEVLDAFSMSSSPRRISVGGCPEIHGS